MASVALAFGLCCIAWWAMPRAIQAGDAGEFATVMLRGGVPHPSGYPWMRILGLFARALESLGMAPTLASALPCALAGVAAWVCIQRTLCVWGVGVVGAVTVGVAACSGIVVGHVNDSEVWGLHLLWCAVVSYFGLARRSSPLVIGAVLGAAVSHHLTAVLLVPLAVGAAWPTENAPARVLRAGGLGLLGSALGLLAYATLAVGSGDAWRWGDTRTLDGLVHHVTRADYGITQLSLHTEPVSVYDSWARSIESLGLALSAQLALHVALGALVLILIIVFARRPECVPRPAWWGMWGAIGTTTLVFPALQNIDPNSPFGAWILERFDLLPLMLWCLPAATALARLARRVQARRLRVMLAVLPAALIVRQVVSTWVRGTPAEEGGVESYAVDMLETPPGPALVFGTDDHRIFPALYATEVLGTRPEVVYVDASLLYHPWYRNRIARRWPGLPVADKPLKMMGQIWQSEEHADTPIYLANVFSKPAATELSLVPEGILWRVVPPHASPEQFEPQRLAERHLAALERYRATPEQFAGLHSPAGHPWSVDLWAPYMQQTSQLAQAMRQNGRADLASDLERAMSRLAQ